jgi:hypothetical protein
MQRKNQEGFSSLPISSYLAVLVVGAFEQQPMLAISLFSIPFCKTTIRFTISSTSSKEMDVPKGHLSELHP